MTEERGEKRVLITVICGAVATCATAAWVTHNGRSTPLTLADVLITAIVPVGLLVYLTRRYRPTRRSKDT